MNRDQRRAAREIAADYERIAKHAWRVLPDSDAMLLPQDELQRLIAAFRLPMPLVVGPTEPIATIVPAGMFPVQSPGPPDAAAIERGNILTLIGAYRRGLTDWSPIAAEILDKLMGEIRARGKA